MRDGTYEYFRWDELQYGYEGVNLQTARLVPLPGN